MTAAGLSVCADRCCQHHPSKKGAKEELPQSGLEHGVIPYSHTGNLACIPEPTKETKLRDN